MTHSSRTGNRVASSEEILLTGNMTTERLELDSRYSGTVISSREQSRNIQLAVPLESPDLLYKPYELFRSLVMGNPRWLHIFRILPVLASTAIVTCVFVWHYNPSTVSLASQSYASQTNEKVITKRNQFHWFNPSCVLDIILLHLGRNLGC